MDDSVLIDISRIQSRAVVAFTHTARSDFQRLLAILDLIRECIEFEIELRRQGRGYDNLRLI